MIHYFVFSVLFAEILSAPHTALNIKVGHQLKIIQTLKRYDTQMRARGLPLLPTTPTLRMPVNPSAAAARPMLSPSSSGGIGSSTRSSASSSMSPSANAPIHVDHNVPVDLTTSGDTLPPPALDWGPPPAAPPPAPPSADDVTANSDDVCHVARELLSRSASEAGGGSLFGARTEAPWLSTLPKSMSQGYAAAVLCACACAYARACQFRSVFFAFFLTLRASLSIHNVLHSSSTPTHSLSSVSDFLVRSVIPASALPPPPPVNQALKYASPKRDDRGMRVTPLSAHTATYMHIVLCTLIFFRLVLQAGVILCAQWWRRRLRRCLCRLRARPRRQCSARRAATAPAAALPLPLACRRRRLSSAADGGVMVGAAGLAAAAAAATAAAAPAIV